MRKFISIMILAVVAVIATSCGIYSFSGTSIEPDVKSITINYFDYKALKVNPTLSNDLTEAMKDKFRQMTRLEQVDEDGDMELEGAVTGYDVRAAAITADEVAAKNRLTVTVHIKFTNNKYPEDNVEKDFSAYAEYDSTNTLDSVESTLCEQIVDQLAEDIFNACVAQW
jgi:hypothetical protein